MNLELFLEELSKAKSRKDFEAIAATFFDGSNGMPHGFDILNWDDLCPAYIHDMMQDIWRQVDPEHPTGDEISLEDMAIIAMISSALSVKNLNS